MAAFGVNHVCSTEPSRQFDENWSVAALTKLRERVESFGIRLDMIPLPLSSAYIAKAESPNIMLGKSPERDREIDNICQMIRNCARAGIPAVNDIAESRQREAVLHYEDAIVRALEDGGARARDLRVYCSHDRT